MRYEPGDILLNEKFKCRYGILLEQLPISYYTVAFKVMTENGPFIWDENDTRFIETPRLNDGFREKNNGPVHEFLYYDIPNMYICIRPVGKQEKILTDISAFLRDFDMASGNSLTSNTYRPTCFHNYQPWPMDIHKQYCINCGDYK